MKTYKRTVVKEETRNELTNYFLNLKLEEMIRSEEIYDISWVTVDTYRGIFSPADCDSCWYYSCRNCWKFEIYKLDTDVLGKV